MKAHDFFRTTSELLSYENSRYTWFAPHLKQLTFNLWPICDFIKLINNWVGSKATYQWCYWVAQATRALAEYHHWLFTNHACDCVHDYEYNNSIQTSDDLILLVETKLLWSVIYKLMMMFNVVWWGLNCFPCVTIKE